MKMQDGAGRGMVVRRRLAAAGKIAATIALLLLIYTRIDPAALWVNFSGMHRGLLAVALAAGILMVALDGYKLTFALRLFSGGAPPAAEMFRVSLIALFYALFVPGGQLVSETVRATKLRRYAALPHIIPAVLLDKAAGLYTSLLVTWCCLLVWNRQWQMLNWWMTALLAAATAGVAVATRLAHCRPCCAPEDATRRGRLIAVIAARAGEILAAVAGSRQLAGRVVAANLGANLFGIVGVYLLARAIGIGVHPGIVGWVFGLVALLQLFPFTVSGLGVREASYAVFLSAYGISAEKAVALGLSIYLLGCVNGLLGGILQLQEYIARAHSTH